MQIWVSFLLDRLTWLHRSLRCSNKCLIFRLSTLKVDSNFLSNTNKALLLPELLLSHRLIEGTSLPCPEWVALLAPHLRLLLARLVLLASFQWAILLQLLGVIILLNVGPRAILGARAVMLAEGISVDIHLLSPKRKRPPNLHRHEEARPVSNFPLLEGHREVLPLLRPMDQARQPVALRLPHPPVPHQLPERLPLLQLLLLKRRQQLLTSRQHWLPLELECLLTEEARAWLSA